MLHATPSALILLLTSAVVSFTSLLAWRRRETPAGRELFWLFASVSIWSLAAAMAGASSNVALSIFWAKIMYIGSVSAGPFTLMFCVAFAHHQQWRTPGNLVALWALPAVILLLAFTNGWHHLIWSSVTPSPIPGSGLFVYHHGPAYWVYIAYNYLYTLAGAGLIFREYMRSGPLYRNQSGAILFSMIFPWMGGILYAFNILPIPGLDITAISFAFTAVIIAWATYGTRLLDLIPVAHSMLLQSMQDAVIVLDSRNRVVETNPAMAHLLGQPELPAGEAASDTFRRWPALAALLAQPPQTPSEIALPGEGTRYFDVRLVPIRNAVQRGEGHLAVLREITGRKQVELALQAKSREMEQQAATDDLTGLYNRRYVDTLLKDEFGRAQRFGPTFSLAVLDIDDLKQINDRFGHQAGDDVLRSVARVLQSCLRASDVAARVGGDEFMVILPYTDLKGAFQLMDRLRIKINEQVLAPGQIHISCSAGLTARTSDDLQETLLQRADRLLYVAKDEGRNRVVQSS